MKIQTRRSSSPRCPYCHDELGGKLRRCTQCSVELHRDCAKDLGSCPTLGCEGKLKKLKHSEALPPKLQVLPGGGAKPVLQPAHASNPGIPDGATPGNFGSWYTTLRAQSAPLPASEPAPPSVRAPWLQGPEDALGVTREEWLQGAFSGCKRCMSCRETIRDLYSLAGWRSFVEASHRTGCGCCDHYGRCNRATRKGKGAMDLFMECVVLPFAVSGIITAFIMICHLVVTS